VANPTIGVGLKASSNCLRGMRMPAFRLELFLLRGFASTLDLCLAVFFTTFLIKVFLTELGFFSLVPYLKPGFLEYWGPPFGSSHFFEITGDRRYVNN
jgi:hypothetical protein